MEDESSSDSSFGRDYEGNSSSSENCEVLSMHESDSENWSTDSEDRTYDPEQENETNMSTMAEDSRTGETLDESQEFYNQLVERGSPPKKLSRRNCKGRNAQRSDVDMSQPDHGRVKCGYTKIKDGLPPLIGIPSNICWNKHAVRRCRVEPFEPLNLRGPKGIERTESATEIFLKLVKEPLEKFKIFSNQKRKELNEKFEKLVYKDLDEKDMLAYVSTLLWMDTRRLPEITEYYSKNPDLSDPFLKRLRENNGFSRNKFRSVYRTARLYDKNACEEDGRSKKTSQNYDPEFKYKELLDSFVLSAQKYMNPDCRLALDESMDLFTVS